MMAWLSALAFSAALMASVAAIAMTIAPQWRRILSLASGKIETSFAPLRQLAHAERRIAVRRWAAAPVPAPIRRMRGAA